jgi:glutamine synthetase
MVDTEGKPHFADPRQILTNVLARFTAMGLTPVVAIEYEFYLIDQKAASKGDIRPARGCETGWRPSTTNVYGLEELYDFEALLDEIQQVCDTQKLPAETFVTEYATGQFEINLHHTNDALKACDQAIQLERCIKSVARKHGVIATFMAKPFAKQAGCGLHIHCSLLDNDGNNVLAGEMDEAIGRPISDMMRNAIGGLLTTMREGMAIFAPNANSYRRLKSGTYAPVRGLWGGDNRTVPLRIPGGSEKAIRVEHRVAGADANPYLVMATVLAGMHYGIVNNVTPPPPVTGDGYAMDTGIELPIRWPVALAAFDESNFLDEYLGEEWCDCFLAARSFEEENHHYAIPQIDYEWYLRTS